MSTDIKPLVDTISIQGLITKWLYQSSSMQMLLVKSSSGGGGDPLEYKIIDFDMHLEGARVGDYVELDCSLQQGGVKSQKDLQTYSGKTTTGDLSFKIVNLKAFNRPFTSHQLYLAISEIKGIKKRDIDSLASDLNLTKLAKLIMDSNWDEIKVILLESPVGTKYISQLLKLFQSFEQEPKNFEFIAITNILLKYRKVGLDDDKWSKCRKLIRKAMQNGVVQSDLINLIETRPYDLILKDKVRSSRANFLIIDNIGKYGPYAKNWSTENPSRQYAGIWCSLLDRLYDHGDCYLGLNELQRESRNMLHSYVANAERKTGKITIYQKGGETIVFPKFMDRWERETVSSLTGYSFSQTFVLDADKLKQIDPDLNIEQIRAILGIVNTGWGIITGPPGVGKTKIISAITRILRENGENLILSAPTGLACKNIAKCVPENAVFTVAKLLHGRKRETAVDSETDIDLDESVQGDDCVLEQLLETHKGIIIDEASMLDISQLYNILQLLPNKNFRIILVGDPNQLPSIGPGQVLTDIIRSEIMPCYRLTVNYRQQQGSQIISNATKIIEGASNLIPGPDFKIYRTATDSETADLLSKLIEHIKKSEGDLRDTVILSPYSKVGFLSSNSLNSNIKRFFNSDPAHSWGNYSVGDRVMQTKNVLTKGIVNGDIGEIIGFKMKGTALDYMTVEYPVNGSDNIRVKYKTSEIREQLTLAYVISVHKSQGNGYPIVIVLVPQNYNCAFFNRNMFYTAVTRAKSIVYLIGGDYTPAIRYKARERNTLLCSRLKRGHRLPLTPPPTK